MSNPKQVSICEAAGKVPTFMDETTATETLCDFTEQSNDGQERVQKRLRRLSQIQRKRKRVDVEGYVVMPHGYSAQCKAIDKALSGIREAYDKADQEVKELLDLLDERIVGERKKLKAGKTGKPARKDSPPVVIRFD